jgi:hypothetical protein
VRFCKPQNVVPLCTPTFRAFVTAQWAQAAAAAKASPDYKKASCKVNALFVSKLHQHITTARLTSLFGKFGKMLACEVRSSSSSSRTQGSSSSKDRVPTVNAGARISMVGQHTEQTAGRGRKVDTADIGTTAAAAAERRQQQLLPECRYDRPFVPCLHRFACTPCIQCHWLL